MSGKEWKGEVVEVFECSKGNKFSTVYVKGLPDTLTTTEIEAMFKAVGKIVNITALTKGNHEFKRNTYITFSNATEMQVAIKEFHNKEVKIGYPIEVFQHDVPTSKMEEFGAPAVKEGSKNFRESNLYVKPVPSNVGSSF